MKSLLEEFKILEGIEEFELDEKDWARFTRFCENRAKEIETEEKLYTKEEVLEQLNLLYTMKNSTVDSFTDEDDRITMKWFDSIKQKFMYLDMLDSSCIFAVLIKKTHHRLSHFSNTVTVLHTRLIPIKILNG